MTDTETLAEAVDEITDEAQKLLDRLETLGVINERALDILGVAAVSLLATCSPEQRMAVLDVWMARVRVLACR